MDDSDDDYSSDSAEEESSDDDRGGDGECGVCLNDDLIKSNSIKLGCGHCFHKTCIYECMKNNISTCPLCRTRFTSKCKYIIRNAFDPPPVDNELPPPDDTGFVQIIYYENGDIIDDLTILVDLISVVSSFHHDDDGLTSDMIWSMAI